MAADMTITDKLAEALRELIPYAENDAAPNAFLDSADAALAEYDANPGGWQTMESAPRDGRRVLCVGGGRVPYIGYHHIDDGWLDESGSFRDPRFWQPIPTPPKESQS